MAAMTIDDEFVYWIGNDWALHKRAKAGGAASIVLPAMPRRDISWLAAGGGWIYWLDGFRLMRVARSGGRQKVTGLVVNGVTPPRVPRKLKRQLRAAIHNLRRGRPHQFLVQQQHIKGRR